MHQFGELGLKCEGSLFTKCTRVVGEVHAIKQRSASEGDVGVIVVRNGANDGTRGINEPVELEVARVSCSCEDIGVRCPSVYVRGDVRARKVASDDFADVGVQEQWDVGVIELEHGVTPY